jgi:ABC-type dipeptide/oligopeptide/nickel transport system permease component
MMRYAARRLLQIIPVLFGISLIVFMLVRLIPGDPAIAVLGSRATPELVKRVHDQLGLDLPLWRQYLHYLDNALHGDFGISFFYQADVWGLTMARLPRTLALMAYSIVLSFVVAIPFSVIAATRRNGIADASIRLGSTVALGIPSFWLGIVLALVLGARLKLLPIGGGGTGGIDTLYHLTLPALTIAFALTPILVRTLRSSLIEVIASDYVTTGRAMGIARRYLLVSYLLRNSFRPVITVLSINVGYLIGGTVVAEQIFSVPGVGSLLIGSIATRDYAIIQLATLLFAILVVLANLAADLLYRILDPRVTL